MLDSGAGGVEVSGVAFVGANSGVEWEACGAGWAGAVVA